MIQSLSSLQPTIFATTSNPRNTQTHLANLERLLRSQPQLQQQQQPVPMTRTRPLPSLRLPQLPFSQPVANEKASPRSLSLLRRLLSDPSQHSSPRTSIASHWRDIHGLSDWSGLIDPLDHDLRRELLRYGDFVHSAYHAFFCSAPPHLPDRSYRITRHLFATSSINLPFAASLRSSPIGFIAVCENDREIRRMGRRDIVIALRGTATNLEWAENLRANLVPLDDATADTQARVECGFRSLHTTPGDGVPSLSSATVAEVRRLLELYKNEELSVTVTGHSLGAALAMLVADELLDCTAAMPPVAVFSFGGPRVGNRAFVERAERKGVKALRVVNARDLVTRVPAAGYQHIGKELRVDIKASPFLKPDADPACCHDLEAYLHLVDGLGGKDGSGFRPNARRSLLKLMSQQRANVKQHYVSQAQVLGFEIAGQPSQTGWFASLTS